MRIDFSRLQEEQIQPSGSKPIFASPLTSLWSKSSMKGMHTPIAEVQQQQPILTFSVSYPYQINRSVSPSFIKKQMAYMQAKKQLPPNTLKFIKRQLNTQLQKQSSHKISEAKMQQSIAKSQSKSFYIQNQLIKPQINNNPKDKIITSKQNQQDFQTYLNSIKKKEPRINNDVKPRVYDIKKKYLRQQKYRDQDLDGVTLKPVLNYTMNSKVAKQVKKKRSQHFKTCNIDVFQSLYHDASIYSTKRQLEKAIIQQQSKVFLRKSSRIQVNSTFQERLQTSIQKEALRKKKAQNKLEYDMSTGHKFFVPDTNKSKNTYQTLFKGRKSSILPLQELSYPARPACYSKESSRFNHSQEYTTTLNNSFEKQLNKSLDSKCKIVYKTLPRQNKLAELYANLIWSEQTLKYQELNRQQAKVLSKFLQQVKKYQNCYSKNVSKQVIIAFFKDTYANMNLFNKAVLHLRLKKNKNIEEQDLGDTLNSKSKLSLTYRKKSSQVSLYHTKKQFYI